MRRFGSVLLSLGVLVAVLGGAWGARAQETASGIVNAVTYYPMPEGLPILVRPLDDSLENLAIKKDMERALTGAGYALARDGSYLVLSFETRRELGGGPRSADVTDRFVERHEESDYGIRRYNPQIGRSSPRGPTSIGASRLRLDATLDDRRSGKRLWRGWTIARLHGDETKTLAEAMAPVLVESLGETVRQQTFDIPVGETGDATPR